MSLTTEMQQKIYESLDDAYGQVKFLQDQVVLLDNDKSGWDQAIFKVGHLIMPYMVNMIIAIRIEIEINCYE